MLGWVLGNWKCDATRLMPLPTGYLENCEERVLVVLKGTNPFKARNACSLLSLVWGESYERSTQPDKSLPMIIISCTTEQAAALPLLSLIFLFLEISQQSCVGGKTGQKIQIYERDTLILLGHSTSKGSSIWFPTPWVHNNKHRIIPRKIFIMSVLVLFMLNKYLFYYFLFLLLVLGQTAWLW